MVPKTIPIDQFEIILGVIKQKNMQNILLESSYEKKNDEYVLKDFK